MGLGFGFGVGVGARVGNGVRVRARVRGGLPYHEFIIKPVSCGGSSPASCVGVRARPRPRARVRVGVRLRLGAGLGLLTCDIAIHSERVTRTSSAAAPLAGLE